MKNKLYSFLFYFGIVWTIFCILGFVLSDNYHLWLDYSVIGVVIFLLSIIQNQKKEITQLTGKKGFMRLDVITCNNCKEKHVAPDGEDNAYNCRKCKKDLMRQKSKRFDVPESQVATFLEKFYKGMQMESRNGGKSYGKTN